MIEKTMLLKIAGGGAFATGTIGGGYYMHASGLLNAEYFSDVKEDEKNYLIVKSVKQDEKNLKDSLYQQNLVGKITKNFSCFFNSTEDKTCEIYKLSDAEKNLSKITIKNNFYPTIENAQEEGNFFKLKIDDSISSSINAWEDTTSSIDLKQNNVSENQKTFSKLIPVYQVKDGKVIKGNKSSLISTVTTTDSAAVTSQPAAEPTNTNKNYLCKINTSEFDCDISEITVDPNKKTVIFNTPRTSTNPPNKSTLKAANKQFEVKAIKSYFENITFDDKTKVNVLSNVSTEANKTYSIMVPQFVATNNEIVDGKKEFISVVLATTATNSGTANTDWANTYKKCSIGNETIKKTCSIYKFSTPQASNVTLSNLRFQNVLTAGKTDSDIQDNKYFVIKFDPAIKNFLTKDTTTIKLTSGVEGKKEYTFTVKANAYLSGTLTDSNYTVNSVYVFE